MPCFFCGKRVSLVRQLTDADFCSDEHRKRYQELTRLALDRLLDAGQRLGTAAVRPEEGPEAAPAQWEAEPVAAEPVAAEPRYEEPQYSQSRYAEPQYAEPQYEAPRYEAPPQYEEPSPPAPEPEPEPGPQTATRRPWRPTSLGSEPAFTVPTARREPIPPEVEYFAVLECEPLPVAAAARMAGLPPIEPAFNAPASTSPPLGFALRGSTLVPERAGRPMTRTMPARSGPGGGNGFAGTAYFENLTPRVEYQQPASGRQLALRPLIVPRLRPAAREAAFHLAAQAHGRSTPRPVLPRFRAKRSWTARFEVADLIRDSRWRAASAPARRVLAPSATFHGAPSCSRHVAALTRGALVQTHFEEMPMPPAFQMAAYLREAPAGRFALATMLPGYAFQPVAEVEIGGPPPVAQERLLGFPAARLIAGIIHTAPASPFHAGSIALPQMEASVPVCGVAAAVPEPLGYPAPLSAAPTAIGRIASGVVSVWPEVQVALPAILWRHFAVSLPVAASLAALGLPTAARRRAAEAMGRAEAFAGSGPAIPRSAPIAAARNNLAQTGYASTSAGVPARGVRPEIRTIPAQFGRPESLVEIPALPAAVRPGRLEGGQLLLGAVRQRAVASSFPPRTTATAEFQFRARTPDCAIHFGERLGHGAHLPIPYPPPQKGSRHGAHASLDFAQRAASIPERPAPATEAALLLAPAEAATHLPAPVTGSSAGFRTPAALPIQGPSDIRLLPVAVRPLAFAGGIEASTLKQIPRPAPRSLSLAARMGAAEQIECLTALPPAPAHVSATHLLRSAAGFPLVPRESRTKPPAARPTDWQISALPAALASWSFSTAAPLTLGASPAIRGEIAGVGIRSTAQASGWLSMIPAEPAVERKSTPRRPDALSAAPIEHGAYLNPVRKAPAASALLAAESPFAAREALLPPEHTIAAHEALGLTAAMILPPRLHTGAAAAVRGIQIGFSLRHVLLPEIRVDSALARISASRCLEECPAGLLPSPVPRRLSQPGGVRVTSVPVPVSAPLGMAAGGVSPIRPFTLGATGLEPLPERRARAMESRRRDAELVAFAISAPIEPASGSLEARRKLEVGVPAAVAGRSKAGAYRPAAESVTAASTQPVELPGPRAVAFAHPLAAAPVALLRPRILNRASARPAAGWEPFGQESAAIEFEAMRTRMGGVRWPTQTSFQFAHEPERPAKAGTAAKIDPRAGVEFAVPAAREPELAAGRPALGGAPITKIATPGIRQDGGTVQKTVPLQPLIRPHRHPSRLPVFHAAVEKAHMPFGVFHVIEIEDWDDNLTSKTGQSHPASPLEPRIPAVTFSPRSAQRLEEPLPAPVDAGPYPGGREPAGVHGEQPFVFDIMLVEDGTALLKMDFEAIAESSSPRWRNALKSASGLFRGMMLFIPCILAMSALLSGCSAKGSSLKENIQNRAAVHMEYDFSKGLDGWRGGDGWTKNWSQDAAGFVRVGQLAVYRPSQQLADYRFEFMGQIGARSMGWVYRAADLQNYYATELTITKPGPLPEVALVRYQVIAGQETPRVQIPLSMVFQNGRPYRIQQDVSGNSFTTSVDGQPVDFWTDDRLRAGAVGFLGNPKDRPDIYWMRVTNNDDFWGKVCGILAPSK
jgi:hypothetical protein